VISRYRVLRAGIFQIPNRESQRPAVSPKELWFAPVCSGLVWFTPDWGGGFRSKPELEKQATLVYSGLLRIAEAPRQGNEVLKATGRAGKFRCNYLQLHAATGGGILDPLDPSTRPPPHFTERS
jgi:hypothetical protein